MSALQPRNESLEASVTAKRTAAVGVPVQPLRNCPAVDDRGRLVACIQDELVVLNEAVDGGIVVDWRLPTGRFIPGSPTIGVDGLIRVHSLSGCVYCIRGWSARVGAGGRG